ncbi:MAG: helicase HerA-like domain-containing protein [Ignavibacteria bacterium]
MTEEKDKFVSSIKDGYTFKGESILLGTAIFKSEYLPGVHIKLPVKTMNRHGLIAGATGTGKTKTLQIIAEGLSSKSIPVLMMDIKGDLSGLAMPGITNPKIEERSERIGVKFSPSGFPVELLTISNEKGVRLRATVSEFGPVLFSKMLELNETQSGLVSLIFKYCDDNGLPLLDLKDFKKMLQYISDEGKKEIESNYGKISTTSTGTILRKVIELEQQNADMFFGETSFEVEDLLKIDYEGKGVISIIRLTDIQSKPKLFSTFLLCMLVEIYNNFEEVGDADQPKLIIFIDEAHLFFQEASKALLEQIETIIKLIRSKGVGIFFCTQNPTDIPDSVLSQLGMKVQHSLRAFTAKDRKMIKLIAQNYPMSDFYNLEDLITSLGIGEAAVTVLSENGTPTPLAATLLCPPSSRMDILSQDEIVALVSKSVLIKKYNDTIDRESAYEILTNKLKEAKEIEEKNETADDQAKNSGNVKQEKSTVEKVLTSTTARQVGRTIARELTRGLLGVLGIGGSSGTRRKKTSWF